MRNRLQHSLLIELLMVLLIFGLCAAVLVQAYGAAYRQSREAGRLNDVLLAAQNLADQAYLDLQAEDTELELEGCILRLAVEQSLSGPGVWRQAVVTAVDSATGETLLQLPCSRYLPGEVSP